MMDLFSIKSLDRPEAIVLEGESIPTDIAQRLIDASITRTMLGAPYVQLTVNDSDRKLLRSGQLRKGATIVLDDVGYELVQVRKSGVNLELVFEDMVAVALRRRVDAKKIAPGVMTHVEFAESMVREEGWIKFESNPALAEKSFVELSRGQPSQNEAESTWAALDRMARERGWRRWVRNGALWYLPDSFLYLGDPLYTIDASSPVVRDDQFDFDVAKPVATMQLTVIMSRWEVPVGELVQTSGYGPGDGKWIVTEIGRSAFSPEATITLVQPQPTLPEPTPQDTGVSGDRGETGYVPGSREAIAAAISGIFPTGTITLPGIDEPGAKRDSIRLRILKDALTHTGKKYVFGAKGPDKFDCSGLVAWSIRKAGGGVRLDGGSKEQYAKCKAAGTLIGVGEAIRTPGALLFRMVGDPTHVAFSLGNGQTMEARGSAYPLGSYDAWNRGWTDGALIPGVGY